MQQLGQGVEQAERFHGQVAADDATNAFQSQADKIFNGDPSRQVQGPNGTMVPDSGFYGLKGEAAMRAWPQVQAQIDQLRQQGGAGLPSPEARLQFESYTRRLQSNYLERGAQHAQQQSQAWRTGVNESSAELARQSIAANPDDVESLKHGLADLTTARVKEAQALSGGDPTIMAAAAQRARAEGAATQAEALIDKNPTLARQVIENARTVLAPDIYDRLVNRVRPMLAGDQADEALRRAARPPDSASPSAGSPGGVPLPPARGDGGPAPAAAAPAPSVKMPTPYQLAGARSRVAAGEGDAEDKAWIAAADAPGAKMAPSPAGPEAAAAGGPSPVASPQSGRPVTAAPSSRGSAPTGAPPVPTFLQGAEAPPPVAASSRLAYFGQVGARHGISGDYLARVFSIEGSAANPKSSAAGYFQFIPSTAAAYGVTNRYDFAQTTEGAARLAADNRAALTRSLGRAPSDPELYLAHQQGSGGAATLLLHPTMAAADALALSAPYNGNRAKAAAAISSNGGDPNAPASAFVAKWESVYSGRRAGNGPVPTFATPGATPYAADSLGRDPLPPLGPEFSRLPDASPPTPAPTLLQTASSAPQVPAPPSPPQGQEPGQTTSARGASSFDDAAAGLPDKAAALAEARALAGNDPIQARMNIAEVNRRYAEQNALTATERAEVSQSIPDFMAAASAGRTDIDFPERQVWRLFPPAKARQIVDEFHANQAVGSMMRGVQWASPDQLAEMQRSISSGQGIYSDALRTHRGRATTGAGTTETDPDTGDIAFFKRREVAGRQIAAEIDRRTRQLVGPDADPAAYVASNSAVRQAAAAVNQQDPASYQRFAAASLEMQGYLGVPEAQRHVLSRGQALTLAGQISGSQDPKAMLGQLATASGSAWPQVFRDAIALGKLPAGYQAVATLDDPHDAALLARTLASEKPGPDGKPGRSVDDTVDLMAGAKGEATRIRDAVRFDSDVKSYVTSIRKSGASDDQVSGVVNAVETLALAKRSAGEAGDSGSAATAAVKSFFGKFDYLPNGGARVPAKSFDAVSANARAAIDGLMLDQVAVPPRFGQPGQPEPREYVDTIKAAPTWITSPSSDALWLMDYGGRLVRGRDGKPVAVPFSLPGPAPVVRAPPLSGLTTMPAAPAAAPLSPAARADAAADQGVNVVPGL